MCPMLAMASLETAFASNTAPSPSQCCGKSETRLPLGVVATSAVRREVDGAACDRGDSAVMLPWYGDWAVPALATGRLR